MHITLYRLLADGILVAHVGLVLFIVVGLPLTLLGGHFQWPWVRNVWFRSLHLAAIGYVMAQSWLGMDCPLTSVEQWLRGHAGQARYDEDFIAHWLGKILFFQAPPWVFTTVYSAFGFLVAASWFAVPPRRRRTRSDQAS